MIEKIWKLTEKGITDYNGKVGSLEEVVEVLNTYHFKVNDYLRENNKLREENEELKQEKNEILDTINNKITEKGMNWYKAEDNSKEEKEANLQLNVLEEIRDELKNIEFN